MYWKTLLAAVFFSALTAPVSAEEDIVKPSVNNGVYSIKTAGNLLWINDNCRQIPDCTGFLLEDDITIDGNWISNINLNVPFDGDNHTITFTSKDKDGAFATGLFNKIINKGRVSNLNISAEIESSSSSTCIGMLANSMEGMISNDGEELSGPFVNNVQISRSVSANSNAVGGLVGSVCGTFTIKQCTNAANVTGTESKYVGGIVGQVYYADPSKAGDNQGLIIGCYNHGLVTHDDMPEGGAVGGIVGYISNEGELADASKPMLTHIRNCLNYTGFFVSGAAPYEERHISSILGYATNTATVYNCVACHLDQMWCSYTNTNVLGDVISIPEPLYRDVNNKKGIDYNSDNCLYTIQDFSDEYSMLLSGEMVYRLNGNTDAPEDPSWFMEPERPYISLNKIDIYSEVRYKHGNVFNNNPHEYNPSDGICKEGSYCYQPIENTNDIYYINNVGQFLYLNENWARLASESKHYCLSEDIDLTKYTWTPNIELIGNFKGQGKTLKFTQTINNDNPTPGLFKSISDYAQVVDIKIDAYIAVADDFKIDNVGVLSAIAGEKMSQYHNLSVGNVLVKGTINAPSATSVGALFGTYEGIQLSISGVASNVDITGGTNVGGLVGNIQNASKTSSTLYFSESVSRGTLSSVHSVISTASNIGGLIGTTNVNYLQYLNINSCGNTGRIRASQSDTYGSIIGGFIGVDYLSSRLNSFQNNYAYLGKDFLSIVDAPAASPVTSFPFMGNLDLSAKYETFNNSCYAYLEGVSSEEDKYPFSSGLITNEAARLAGVNKDAVGASLYRQGISTETPDPYPLLVKEITKTTSNYLVFKTCNDKVFSNTNYWTKNDDKYAAQWTKDAKFDHPYDDTYHVCTFCGSPDTEYWKSNNEVSVESTDDLTNMVDKVSSLTENQIPVAITVEANIVYDDELHKNLTNENVDKLEESLPAKESIGSAEKPFVGSMDGRSMDIVNFAFKQNALFGQVGKPVSSEEGSEWSEEDNEKVEIKDLSISNGIVFSDLETSVKVKDDDQETIYAAALANVNYGAMSYCSFVGTLAVPSDKAASVSRCLVGENFGSISNSFVYFTDIDNTVSLNKAAILVKSNSGVGRNSGSSKKVAANTTSNTAVTDDSYYDAPEDELKKAERLFTNEEFASGVVAYWLNFEGDKDKDDYGYTGKYTNRYSQGKLTPVLAETGGSNALHRVVYTKNLKDAAVIGAKAYLNSGSQLTLSFEKEIVGVKVDGQDVAPLAGNKSCLITIPTTDNANVNVEIDFAEGATAADLVKPDKANVVAEDGSLRVFGADGETIFVYSLDGSLVHSEIVANNTILRLNLNKGIYFVKVGGTVTKVLL